MISHQFSGGGALALWSTRAEGDALVSFAEEAALPRESSLFADFEASLAPHADLPRTYHRLRQTHSKKTRLLNGSQSPELLEGDALISQSPTRVPVVLTADCVPLALYAPQIHAVAAVHGGWRGLVGGIVERTVEDMRAMGATDIFGAVGPFIRSECYEFKGEAASEVLERFGSSVFVAEHLDLSLVLEKLFYESGVTVEFDAQVCSSCDGDIFSARGDRTIARIALAVGLLS